MKAFAGNQARNKYKTQIALMKVLPFCKIFKEAAENEKYHAIAEFKHIIINLHNIELNSTKKISNMH